MNSLLRLALGVTLAPAAASYLALHTALSGKPKPWPAVTPRKRFHFIVPAHNEAAGIAETVSSLLRVDYPRELFEVVVVADNCADDTAERARQAGAVVLERNDTTLRGKGYALHYAFERLPPEVDAVVVIDADTLVSTNILRAFAARLEAGAQAMQADYAVRNPDASWRTRLIAIAFGSFHIVRSRGRERLGLSCGLRGNGMCFSREVLQEVPHQAYSLVEDVEYGIRLGEAGHRVHYTDEAHVYGEMVSKGEAAKSQRRRWEEGRVELVQKHALRLLKKGLTSGNRVLLDLSFDLLVPPLSRIAVYSFVGLAGAAASTLVLAAPLLLVPVYASCLGVVAVYVLRGWSLSGTGLSGLRDLGFAPVYVVWKGAIARRTTAASNAEWVRTRREQG